MITPCRRISRRVAEYHQRLSIDSATVYEEYRGMRRLDINVILIISSISCQYFLYTSNMNGLYSRALGFYYRPMVA